jgi:hypothetical protein
MRDNWLHYFTWQWAILLFAIPFNPMLWIIIFMFYTEELKWLFQGDGKGCKTNSPNHNSWN